MLPMFFWKFNTHRSWSHFIAMLYSQLSGSNHPLNVTTSISSGWPRKWVRGNVKSIISSTNHPIWTNDPSECLPKWVLLCLICFMQISLISRSPRVKRSENLDHARSHARGGHIQWAITTTKLWVQHCYEVVSWPMGVELAEKHW